MKDFLTHQYTNHTNVKWISNNAQSKVKQVKQILNQENDALCPPPHG